MLSTTESIFFSSRSSLEGRLLAHAWLDKQTRYNDIHIKLARTALLITIASAIAISAIGGLVAIDQQELGWLLIAAMFSLLLLASIQKLIVIYKQLESDQIERIELKMLSFFFVPIRGRATLILQQSNGNEKRLSFPKRFVGTQFNASNGTPNDDARLVDAINASIDAIVNDPAAVVPLVTHALSKDTELSRELHRLLERFQDSRMLTQVTAIDSDMAGLAKKLHKEIVSVLDKSWDEPIRATRSSVQNAVRQSQDAIHATTKSSSETGTITSLVPDLEGASAALARQLSRVVRELKSEAQPNMSMIESSFGTTRQRIESDHGQRKFLLSTQHQNELRDAKFELDRAKAEVDHAQRNLDDLCNQLVIQLNSIHGGRQYGAESKIDVTSELLSINTEIEKLIGELEQCASSWLQKVDRYKRTEEGELKNTLLKEINDLKTKGASLNFQIDLLRKQREILSPHQSTWVTLDRKAKTAIRTMATAEGAYKKIYDKKPFDTEFDNELMSKLGESDLKRQEAIDAVTSHIRIFEADHNNGPTQLLQTIKALKPPKQRNTYVKQIAEARCAALTRQSETLSKLLDAVRSERDTVIRDLDELSTEANTEIRSPLELRIPIWYGYYTAENQWRPVLGPYTIRKMDEKGKTTISIDASQTNRLIALLGGKVEWSAPMAILQKPSTPQR